jgi:hypothetical protein
MDELIESLDSQFLRLSCGWRELIDALEPELLYRQPLCGANSYSPSCGEHLVRSARLVEQTFGGLTANLWDDPFEWTLPETLPTPEKMLAYFNEVEATRKRGFELFKSDEDLRKEIVTPSGETQLLSLLLDTLLRAGHHHLSAKATFDLLSALGPKSKSSKLKTEN